jgi:hypothetical protein
VVNPDFPTLTTPLALHDLRLGRAASSHSYGRQSTIRRTVSPPAQAYFETTDAGASHPISPDADAHFAYSTALRRHGVADSPTAARRMSLELTGGLADKIWRAAEADPRPRH